MPKPDPTTPMSGMKPIGATGGVRQPLPNPMQRPSGQVPLQAPNQQLMQQQQPQPQANPGWNFGVGSLAAQHAVSPVHQIDLQGRNSVLQQRQASDNRFKAMTDVLNSLAIKPVPPLIKKALGLA